MPEDKKLQKKRQRGEISPNKDNKKPKTISQETQQIQTSSQQQPVGGSTFIKAIKPIVTKTSLLIIKETVSKLKLTKKPYFKVISNNNTHIQCDSLEDKKIIIEALKNKLINHHTYLEQSEKPLSLILKGFYDTKPDELLKMLTDHQIPATNVKILFKSDYHTLFLVNFKQGSITCNELNHNHRIIDDIAVKWEPVKNKNKPPLQCHRCQRWGHSTAGCGYQYRCIKCTEDHPIGECPRKTREGNAKCCNCRGDHAANHRGCESFKAFEKWSNSRKSVKSQPKKLIQQRLSAEDFPTLTSQPEVVNNSFESLQQHTCKTPTFSQAVKSQVSASLSREPNCIESLVTDVTSQLMNNPQIHNTLMMLQKLIEQLTNISVILLKNQESNLDTESPHHGP